jgi:ABC-type glutathione transport system ATPase component
VFSGGVANKMTALLDLRLTVDYPKKPGVLRDVRLRIAPAEVVGPAGRTGSGTSTLALSIMRLLDGKPRRNITFQGRELLDLRYSERRLFPGRSLMLAAAAPALLVTVCFQVVLRTR